MKNLIELVAAYQLGDGRAIEPILTLLQPLITRMARGWAPSLSPLYDEDDLAQEARLVCLDGLRSWMSDSGVPVESYLGRCIAHRFSDIQDQQRCRKRGSGSRPLSLSAPTGRDEYDEPILLGDILADTRVTDPVEATLNSEGWDEALNALTGQQQEMAHLIVEGYNVAAIARMMGITYDQARGVKGKIKKALASYYPDPEAV